MTMGQPSLVTVKAWLDYIQDKKNTSIPQYKQPCGKQSPPETLDLEL